MTNEEAFLILLETIMPVDKENEALEKALEALRKQIPEKPIIEHYKHYDAYSCPKCGRCFVFKDETGFFTFTGERSEFCNKCGKAIDWSDER